MRRRLGLSFMVPALLLMSLATVQAEVITFDHNGNQAGFELIQQTARGVELKFRLEQVRLEEMTVDGTVYQQVSIPGIFLPVQAGAPNLPSLGRMVALPGGALTHLTVIGTKRETIRGIDVLPAAPIPWDTDNSPAVYAPDPAIYGRDSYWPEQTVQLSDRKKMRGVDAVILGISPFQYNPVRKELIVFSEIHLRLDFEGGNGTFGQDRLRSKNWDSILRQHLLNFDSLPALETVETDAATPYGEYEYVIITPDDPVYIQQAERLRDFRIEQGISTGVVTLTETGSTAAAIEEWINFVYEVWQRPPEAVLLLADWTADGLTDGITCPKYNDYCVSDNIYADYDGDHMPDIVFARMTATPENVAHLVDKAIDYESSPPLNPRFYQNPLLACGWQQDRWFCLCSEIVHGFLDNALQKTPVREYVGGESVTDEWSSNQNTWMLIDYFGPNGLGYIPLTPEHLTDWTGDADGINDAINSGAFITQHRDHGGTTGWAHPAYYIDDMAGLYNEDLTYVFSMNCLTGKFDSLSEVFTEAFHRMENGALGVVAATQVSYSFVNDTLVFGMWDYMWPDFDPGHGASGPLLPRPAWALASGKYFLRDSVWPYNPQNKEVTYHLFHAHGDAYTTLYTEVPQVLSVETWGFLPVGSHTFGVSADEGATIALTANGEILGVVEATGGWQEMEVEPYLVEGEVTLTVTKVNHFRYSEAIPVGFPCTYAVEPADVPISQASQVQVTMWSESGDPASNATVTIDGWGIVPVSGLTDGSGQILLTVDPPYGEDLVIRGQEDGKTYYCLEGELPVTGGADLGSEAISAEVPLADLAGILTPGIEGLLTGSCSESDFTFYAAGSGVDTSVDSGASSSTQLTVLPTVVGVVKAAIGKPGFRVFEQAVPVQWVEGAVSGTVVDAQGAPLEGALVKFYPLGSDPEVDLPWAYDMTDASGSYSFFHPLRVAYWDAYVTKFGYDLLQSTVIVKYGATTIDFSLVTAPHGLVSGTVTDAETGDPVEAFITVYRADAIPIYATALTDAETGAYEISLPYYDYRIVAETVLHYTEEVALTVDQTALTQDFSMTPSLAGILVIDDTWVGNTTSDGALLEVELQALGCRVTREFTSEDLQPSEWWKYSAVIWATRIMPDPEHRLALRNYLGGGGRVAITSTGLASAATGYEYWFSGEVLHGDDTVSGDGILELIVETHPLASSPNTLGDMVVTGYFADEAIDPRPDAEVVYAWSENFGDSAVLTWDDDPDPDHGNLVYFSLSYDQFDLSDRELLLENLVHYLNNRDWQAAVGEVSGTVVLEGETEHGDVMVTTDPPTTSAMTGPDGSYVLYNVPPGTYSIIAGKYGFVSDQAGGIEVVEDQTTTEIDFLLPIQYAEGLLSGTVRDATTGEPVEAWVEIYRNDDLLSLMATTTSDPATGHYEAQLLYGEYRIVAEGIHHFTNAAVALLDQPGVTQDLELTGSLGGILIIDQSLGSAEQLESDLRAIDYKPALEHYSDTDPATWWDYEAVVWSAGNTGTPLTYEDDRLALRDYLAAGGRLLLESGNVANSATMNNREEWFFSDVLHADYLTTSAGYLELSAGSHVLANSPNSLGDIMPADLGIDDDVVDPRPDAELIYGWSDQAAGSGLLVWDNDPDPDHGNLVYMSFDYLDIDLVERVQLLENMAHYLVNRDGVTPELGGISGTALLDGESDHSGIMIATLPASATALTATDGSYELSNVLTGTYSVVATKDGWTDDQVDGVVVVSDQTTAGIDFLLYAEISNLPPEAENQQVSTKLNKSVTITLVASDPDGDLLTYICVDYPSNGTLSGCDDDDQYVTYTPNNQFTGNDSFTFKANDGELDSNEATVTVKVTKGGGGGGGKPIDGVATLQLNPREDVN